MPVQDFVAIRFFFTDFYIFPHIAEITAGSAGTGSPTPDFPGTGKPKRRLSTLLQKCQIPGSIDHG